MLRQKLALCEFKIKLAIRLPNRRIQVVRSRCRNPSNAPPPRPTFVYISSGLLNCGLFCVHHGSPRPLNFPARHSTIIFAPRHVPPPLASPEIGARVCLQACIPPRGKKPTFSRGGTLIDSPLARILITVRSIYSLRSFSIFFSKVVAPFAPCTYFFSNGIFFELFSIFVNDILEHIIIIIIIFFH